MSASATLRNASRPPSSQNCKVSATTAVVPSGKTNRASADGVVRAGQLVHGRLPGGEQLAGGGQTGSAQQPRDELVAQQMFADVFIPRAPICPAFTVHKHQWHDAALAGLHERQGLVAFIHGAEASGEEDNRV